MIDEPIVFVNPSVHEVIREERKKAVLEVLDRIENIELPDWPEYHWERIADEIKAIKKEL